MGFTQRKTNSVIMVNKQFYNNLQNIYTADIQSLQCTITPSLNI